MKNQRFQLRLTIGTKLIGLVALLLVSSIATIVYQSTDMYVQNDTRNIDLWNVETTGDLQAQVREVFGDLADKMRYLGTLLWQDTSQNPANNPIVRGFFQNDKNFLGVVIQKKGDQGTLTTVNRAVSPEMNSLGDGTAEKALAALAAATSYSPGQLLKGEVQIVPVKLSDNSAAVAVAIPLVQSETDPTVFTHTAVAFIRPAKFSSSFGDSLFGSSFLVDRQGVVLAHTDPTRIGENFSQVGAVKEFLTGSKPQNQVSYTDPASHEEKMASYRAVGIAGLAVVTELPKAFALDAATRISRRAAKVGLIILFIAFWAGYMYSGTITRPIKKLVEAAQRIAGGDFKIDLKAKGKDEVAHLSRAFNEMARGLEERDRVKETFNKFHNKEIAEKLLSGEVKLGGERKQATIFFSDVRGFTAMSETMEPEQVVEMLNEYMTRMVAIVRKHHGIVDKYVGDAIMALWGVPISGGNDTLNAVRACLEMREELARLNELRLSRGQNALKIGMGLNSGPVIAGNIGSTEKMEYTVIGDSVNLASRMESMTKEYGTDLLIPKSIFDEVQNHFVFEKCRSAKVKGKASAIEIYKVKGYVNEAGQPVVIETPYSSYEAEKSDKVVHDPEPAGSYIVEESSKLTERTNPLLLRPSKETSTAEIEHYYVKMFGEKMGPFTETEVRQGIQAGEFPSDACVSKDESEGWTPIQAFGTPVAEAVAPVPREITPPPFHKNLSVPPVFKGPKKPSAA